MKMSDLESEGSIVDTKEKETLHNDTINTTLLCRGCLVSYGEMKNMKEWSLTDDFCRIANVQIVDSEGISVLLCLPCEEMLINCRQWISRCQESDEYLRNTVHKNHPRNCATDNPENTNAINNKRNTASCLLFETNLVLAILAPNEKAKVHLPCPYQCQETFLKKSDLHCHMTKNHHTDATFPIDLQYYCSVDSCPYHMNSGKGKHFKGRKFLNQHYNKVHRVKFPCKNCRLLFTSTAEYERHLKTCNITFKCQMCTAEYKTNETLLVHLMRKHPAFHQQYKNERKAEKRKSKSVIDSKKVKTGEREKFDYSCDSPKRSFATQTLENIKNDVTLSSWPEKADETKRDEISTQTVFEDMLSYKSSEEDSIFCSETVSLSDIQTQTFPLEFGLSRSNKETITSETQSPDLSLKGTQTCFCLYSPKSNRFVDSVSSSPGMFTSTETQTPDVKDSITDLMCFISTETQTCFDELKDL